MVKGDSVIAVVVLYKSRFDESVSVKSLSDSICAANWAPLDLVVYDNSPEYNQENLNNQAFRIHYIPDYTNAGVSKAYNSAFQIGVKLQKKYLLLLDQDTTIPCSYCSDLALVSDSNSLIVPKLVNKGVLISPCRYRLGRGIPLNEKECLEGVRSLKGINFLNSGILVTLSLFEAVGGYDENIPLYFSDFNFFNRLKKCEKSFFQMKTIFFHDMSSNDETDLERFFKRFELYCDGAFRCYNNFSGIFMMSFNVLLRALKLGFRHRTLRFLLIAFNRFNSAFN